MDWFRDQVKKGLNVRTYVLLGFLAAMLVWIHSLDVKRNEFRKKSAAITIAPAPAAPSPAHLAQGSGERAVATPAGWGSDPFEPRVLAGKEPMGAVRPITRTSSAAATAGLYLQGIMNGPMGRTALINGNIYREGQRIGTLEVIQIGSKAVMLLDRGTVRTLTLKGDGG